ncbi:MAG TPA: YraN family protein, partial [Muribaculaceae bacterium]|nr:YraN family protein [Muribaculaceae bacterium]
ERLCRAWLIEHHWHVLACNWHCRFGEIDIIALTSHSTIVFVEVKTRQGADVDAAVMAVDADKQHNLIVASRVFMKVSGLVHHRIRYDIVAVNVENGLPSLTHLRGVAFSDFRRRFH